MHEDRPTKRKYARIERERRFLLEGLPDSLDINDYERLVDCYIAETNMRLRRVEWPDGRLVVLKLGQKFPVPESPDNPRLRQMTTLYMETDEFKVFSFLPGRHSTKRRYKLKEQGWTFCIDVYEKPSSAAGVILCEVECDTDEALDAIVTPTWAVREITEEPKWSGAFLAREKSIVDFKRMEAEEGLPFYEWFTERASKVMQLADAEAKRLHHEHLGTEHILLGLIKEGSGVAANVLKNYDLNIQQIRVGVERLVPKGPERIVEDYLPLEPSAEQVITFSNEEARNLTHNYVGTEHLLLGLLRAPKSTAVRVLLNLGESPKEIRNEVLNLLGYGLI